MKTHNSIQRTMVTKLILGMLISTFAFAAAANAQSAFSGRFVLPQGVRWNHAVLPAGEYVIEMGSITAPAVLHFKNTGDSFYTATPMVADSEKGATQLNITIRGRQRHVRSLDLPAIHKTLIFEPLTKAERERIAKAGEAETVIVATARE